MHSGEGGFSAPVLVLMVAMMVLIIGGLSVDLWRVLAEHRAVAGLVDGAATAGATGVDTEAIRVDSEAAIRLDPTKARARACDYLEVHGGLAPGCASPGIAVAVVDASITVRLERDVDLTLLRLVQALSGDTAPISVGAESTATALRGTP
jgi:hypothetical protein